MLRNLLVLLSDSRKSYMDLSNRVLDMRTKDFLNELSWGRIALETALMAEARRIGIPLASGGMSSNTERLAAMKEVCDSVSSAGVRHVMTACARGEGYLLELYEEALTAGELDDSIRSLLSRQRAQVLGNVKELRNRRKAEGQTAA